MDKEALRLSWLCSNIQPCGVGGGVVGGCMCWVGGGGGVELHGAAIDFQHVHCLDSVE